MSTNININSSINIITNINYKGNKVDNEREWIFSILSKIHPLCIQLGGFMLFDFDRFTVSTKLAYRRCNGSAYSLEDVLHVFRYYFDTYEMIFDTAHPIISIAQIARIIEKMPFVIGEHNEGALSDITPEEYEAVIDQHFVTKYRHCDFNINHFFSGDIREHRYYETLY